MCAGIHIIPVLCTGMHRCWMHRWTKSFSNHSTTSTIIGQASYLASFRCVRNSSLFLWRVALFLKIALPVYSTGVIWTELLSWHYLGLIKGIFALTLPKQCGNLWFAKLLIFHILSINDRG